MAPGPDRVPGDVPLHVREVATLDELRDDWERLAREDGDVFRSLAWARAVEQAAGSGRRRLLAFTRPDGVVVGIAPLVRLRSSPVRLFGFSGQGLSDQVGPVCHPRDRAVVAAALRRAILGEPGRRPAALLARGLVREQGWAELMRGVVVGSQPSLVLRLEGDWERWLAARSSNFRQQVRGRERRLERDHGLRYHQVTAAAELGPALAAMVALHGRQWQGRSVFFTGPARTVQLAFAPAALERGWLRLWRADLDGEPAAYYLGYAYGGDHWYFQMARDPARDEQRIGFVLLANAVRCAFAEGAARFRLLSGTHEYKQRFATEDAGHETVVVAGAALARSAQLAFATVRRLPDGLRETVLRRARI